MYLLAFYTALVSKVYLTKVVSISLPPLNGRLLASPDRTLSVIWVTERKRRAEFGGSYDFKPRGLQTPGDLYAHKDIPTNYVKPGRFNMN